MAVVSDGQLVLERDIREDDNLITVELGQIISEASVGYLLAVACGERKKERERESQAYPADWWI